MARIRVLMFFILLPPALVAQEIPDSVYINITPDFITNYDEGARLKYIKASVSLKVVGESEPMVRHHLPSIKNGLILLFTSQGEENLSSTVGREILRREALDEVRRIIAELETSGEDQVEDLYFTNFVVQQ